MRGAESQRLDQDSANPAVKSRVFFYVESGKGIRKESGFGAYPHGVQLNNLYN